MRAARIVLELTGDRSADDVRSWDVASFGRTQFTVRIVKDAAEQVLRDHVQQQAATKQQQEFKKQQLWVSYRIGTKEFTPVNVNGAVRRRGWLKESIVDENPDNMFRRC